MPKIIKVGQCFTELFKNNTGTDEIDRSAWLLWDNLNQPQSSTDRQDSDCGAQNITLAYRGHQYQSFYSFRWLVWLRSRRLCWRHRHVVVARDGSDFPASLYAVGCYSLEELAVSVCGWVHHRACCCGRLLRELHVLLNCLDVRKAWRPKLSWSQLRRFRSCAFAPSLLTHLHHYHIILHISQAPVQKHRRRSH